MALQWTSKSRYGDVRCFIYDAEKQEVTMTCDNVLYVSYIGHPEKVVTAVDPDGGPFLCVDGLLSTVPSGPVLHILRILSYLHTGNGLKVTLSVRVKEEEVKEEEVKEEKKQEKQDVVKKETA
jgi:hypothetical protein